MTLGFVVNYALDHITKVFTALTRNILFAPIFLIYVKSQPPVTQLYSHDRQKLLEKNLIRSWITTVNYRKSKPVKRDQF